MKQIRYLAVFTCFALLASGWPSSTRAQEPSVKVSMFASGLVNPRGLKFGPDGNLYVAEGGTPIPPIIEAPAGLGGDCSAGANGPGDYLEVRPDRAFQGSMPTATLPPSSTSCHPARPVVLRVELPTLRSLETRCTPFTRELDVRTACPAFRTRSSA